MSIKGAIKKLEGALARNRDQQFVTFVIPLCRDASQLEKLQNQLIHEHGLANKPDVVCVFVTDYSKRLSV